MFNGGKTGVFYILRMLNKVTNGKYYKDYDNLLCLESGGLDEEFVD